MSRIHLFEIEDQRWCPRLFRDFLTDYLKHFEDMTNIYKDTAPIIEKGLATASKRQVIDLCSGACGPWSRLVEDVKNVNVLLTDLFPNQERMNTVNADKNSNIRYSENSVNAMNVSKDLAGLRTLYTSFHHFRPEEGKSILKDAVEKNEPIAVFEFTERTLLNYFISPIASSLAVFITTPFIKPRKLSRFLFTYLIPIVPLMTVWDGYISNLRTYSVIELNSMIKQLEAEHYEWDIGQLKTSNPGIRITYLLGRPKSRILKEVQEKVENAAELA